MRAQRKIVDLEIREISLVSEPACEQATVEITKSRRRNIERKASGPVCRVCNTSVKDADKFCRECGAPFYKTTEDEVTENKTKAEDESAETTEVEKAEETKVEETEVEKAEEAEVEEAEVEKTEEAEVEKAEEAETEATEVEEAVEKSEVVEKDAQIAELRKALAEKERVLKVKDASDRATATMKSLPVQIPDLAEMLVALQEQDADLAKSIEELLVKASALIEEGALTQASATKTEDSQSVHDRVESMAKARAEEKGISVEKARAEIWHEHPEFYKDYQNEKVGA